jgi:hypothetical protein
MIGFFEVYLGVLEIPNFPRSYATLYLFVPTRDKTVGFDVLTTKIKSFTYISTS